MTQQRRTSPLSHSLMPGERLQDCVLKVIEGPDAGRSISVDVGRLTIGADQHCDFVMTDPTVSSVHAEVALMPHGIRFRDLGSTNGIHFLGTQITDAVLQPGSVLSLGKSSLAIVAPQPANLEPLEESGYGSLLGESLVMRRLFALLRRLEGSELTVLIEGETGSGKTIAAEMIHARSSREGPLITVDCAAISAELIQSELFGHRRGAFTGAVDDRVGAIEAAHGGTLLLDQIGDLPLHLQPTLLRFLETHKVQPIGSAAPREVDVRVLATSGHDLEQEVRAQRFRADLYYRITIGRVRVPPLRDRPEDILPLARRFLEELGCYIPERHEEALKPDAQKTVSLSAADTATLQSYHWPGNVRQLRNAMLQLVTLGTLFPDQIGSSLAEERVDFHTAKARLVERFERTYLEQLLREQRGNMSAAARESGVARHHLRALLKKHGIDPERYRGS
jgi:two-component system response regulator GlrR